MAWTKYCKTLCIRHIQQFLKSRKNIHTDTACNGDLWWEWNLSSQINTEGSFESDDSDISKDEFSFRYVGELECKDKKLKSMEFSNDNKSNSDDKENGLNSSMKKISIGVNPRIVL